jgi:hypothetical protein
LTTLSFSASGIFAICCDLTRPTITRLARTFQSKDAPSTRPLRSVGRILPTPFLGGLHHLYVRV